MPTTMEWWSNLSQQNSKKLVEVKQEHIDDGTHSICGCPLARALGLRSDDINSYVCRTFAVVGGVVWWLPEEAWEFTWLFDTKHYDRLKPQTFELTLAHERS